MVLRHDYGHVDRAAVTRHVQYARHRVFLFWQKGHPKVVSEVGWIFRQFLRTPPSPQPLGPRESRSARWVCAVHTGTVVILSALSLQEQGLRILPHEFLLVSHWLSSTSPLLRVCAAWLFSRTTTINSGCRPSQWPSSRFCFLATH